MRTAILLVTVLFTACTIGESDSSLYLTGTEEGYVTAPDGTKTCDGKKALICHIPPGNPANAHTICVSKHAVAPHQAQHGDTLGACAIEPVPPPPEPPPPDPTQPPPTEPPPTDQPPPVIN